MSWKDATRLRGIADKVRALGWINVFITFAWCVLHSSDGVPVLLIVLGWGATGMGVTYSVAFLIDRRANRVVGR